MHRLLFFMLILLIASCQKEVPGPLHFPQLGEVPDGFPEVIFPEGNELTQARWELGKKLFFDPIMSADNSISCASCHLPELAFSDNRQFSPGVDGKHGTRHSMSLINLASIRSASTSVSQST